MVFDFETCTHCARDRSQDEEGDNEEDSTCCHNMEKLEGDHKKNHTHEHESHSHHHRDSRLEFYENHVKIFLGAAAIFLALAITWEILDLSLWVGQVFAAISVTLSGVDVYQNAWQELKNKRLNINFLMGVAAIGSFFIFKGQEGATAIFLFSLAELIEDYTTDRSKRAVSKLIALAPDETLIKHDHQFCPDDGVEHDEFAATIKKPTEKIQVGETFVVLPGQRIPLDGTVVCGESYVDQSSVTGESIPVRKSVEAESIIYAGTVNGDGYLEAIVTTPPANTLLARITKELKAAQKNKSQVEKFVEKFARYYTPTVSLLALLVIIIPPVFFNQPFATWFYRGLVLLVVSCPCALTLSTPVTMISALTRLSSHGILVKGSKYIEEIDRIKAFAFDKTGTLTKGQIAVHDIVPHDSLASDEILQIAGSLESKSEHPIARAITRAAAKKRLTVSNVEGFQIHKGKGIQGTINARQYHLGSVEFARELGVHVPGELIDNFRKAGKTVLVLVGNSELIGILTVRDVVRESAAILTYALKGRNKETMILSGDNPQTVASIADCMAISEYRGGLLPDQKIEEVKKLRAQHNGVVMVGDGINDAPALATANVGIAMGKSGSDITLENADVTIMNDDLTKVIVLLNVAHQTAKKLRQNIWGSILIKLTLAILTLFGFVTLWFAVGIGDMGVSIAVVLNGLTLLRFKDFSFEIEAALNGDLERTSVCVKCGDKFTTPKHCGLQMIPKGGKLVCWREIDAGKSYRNISEPHFTVAESICETCQQKSQ